MNSKPPLVTISDGIIVLSKPSSSVHDQKKALSNDSVRVIYIYIYMPPCSWDTTVDCDVSGDSRTFTFGYAHLTSHDTCKPKSHELKGLEPTKNDDMEWGRDDE